MMVDIDQMSETVMEWFDELDKNDQESFIAIAEEDLINLHQSLGRSIRNEFKLWEHEWTPELVNDIDCSNDHPDAISMLVITQVWRDLQEPLTS